MPTPPKGAGGARPFLRLAAGPALIAAAATILVLATVAPQAGGPGVTCDELFDVISGKELVTAFRHQGLSFFAPRNIQRNFPYRPGGPPMHPPLAMGLLGWTHHLFDPAPDNPMVVSVAAARFAPALALGVLVFLVGLWTAAAEGPLAGTVAAAAVVLVPRVFGHGHLAGLDLITALFFTAAILAVAEATRRYENSVRSNPIHRVEKEPRGTGKRESRAKAAKTHEPGSRPHECGHYERPHERGPGTVWRTWLFAAAGVVWGLAMLVRLHGLLVLPPVVVWVVWRLKQRAALPLAAWIAAGGATFFLGWPWLWLAPLDHLHRFLGTATGRQTLHVFYAGKVWADTDVPWHYPLVMFVVVLPVGLLLLGLLGLWAKRGQWRDDSGYWLAMGALAFMLALFAWPGVPVYDGVRLFLMVFPLWAISVGVGAKWIVEHRLWGAVGRPARVAVLGLFLALQGIPLVTYHPCQLSHYSLLVGGLRGAERLGFEVTYWGDAVTEPLLAAAAAGAPRGRVLFAPNLAPFQAPGVQISSPALAEGKVTLIGWEAGNPKAAAGCRFGIFYRRKADLDSVPEELLSGQVIAEQQIQGVWVARVVKFPGAVGARS